MSLLRRLSNLFTRRELDQEIGAELRSHIEMRIEDNIAAGMSKEEAHRDAMLRFGNPALMKERVTGADAALISIPRICTHGHCDPRPGYWGKCRCFWGVEFAHTPPH